MAIESSGRERQRCASSRRWPHDLALPLTIVFGVAGVALLALGIVRAATRRRGIWAAGITIALAGGLLAAVITGARDVVLHQFDTDFGDAVVSQVWTAYLGDLRVWALALGAGGLVVAAAAGGPRLSLALAARRRRLRRPAGWRARLGLLRSPRSRSRCPRWCCTRARHAGGGARLRGGGGALCACSRRRTARLARRAPPLRRPPCWR